ncbi:ero1-like protein [Apis mellifera carnica]|nr:ero1-like protein [Apis mellifera carnica]
MKIESSENMFGVLILFTVFSPSIVHSNYFNTNNEKNDQCFCKLKGSIDDCSCNVDTVDYFNNMKIYPRVQSLLVKDYFRFYKVNLNHECPFWTDDSKCAIRYCHVQPCQDEDIPDGLKGDILRNVHFNENPMDKYKIRAQYDDCLYSAKDHNKELGYLNTTISSENYKDFELWQQYDDAQDNFCVKESSPGEYVDLLLNPERYTGYKGPSAHRIWKNIYMENCFRPENSPHNFIQSSKINGMCLEKRVFYRVISGLHAKLRALAKAAPYLEREEYYTGNKVQDKDTRLAINDILNIIKSFPDHFNESVMFTGGSEAQLLKDQFKQHFRNISRIMDCVGCDKCKLWGKLQIHGLGTALKILFSGKFDRWESTLNNFNRRKFFLERSEIVALINAFGRLSESIFELDKFRQMLR